jgi:hypothetical protein
MDTKEKEFFDDKMKLRKTQFEKRVEDMKHFIKWALDREVGNSNEVRKQALKQVLKEIEEKNG